MDSKVRQIIRQYIIGDISIRQAMAILHLYGACICGDSGEQCLVCHKTYCRIHQSRFPFRCCNQCVPSCNKCRNVYQIVCAQCHLCLCETEMHTCINCDRIFCEKDIVQCKDCKAHICEECFRQYKVIGCKEQHCPRCDNIDTCSYCGQTTCDNCIKTLSQFMNRVVCNECYEKYRSD